MDGLASLHGIVMFLITIYYYSVGSLWAWSFCPCDLPREKVRIWKQINKDIQSDPLELSVVHRQAWVRKCTAGCSAFFLKCSVSWALNWPQFTPLPSWRRNWEREKALLIHSLLVGEELIWTFLLCFKVFFLKIPPCPPFSLHKIRGALCGTLREF